MSEFSFLTITQISAAFQSGVLRPGDLTKRLLLRIERLNGRFNAFLLLPKALARAEAKQAESMIRFGSSGGLLQRIPYAVKDLFDVQGIPATAGCRLLSQNISQTDSAAGSPSGNPVHQVRGALGGLTIASPSRTIVPS